LLQKSNDPNTTTAEYGSSQGEDKGQFGGAQGTPRTLRARCSPMMLKAGVMLAERVYRPAQRCRRG
jgi:hypothetical protein